jgi:hypothetical protein
MGRYGNITVEWPTCLKSLTTWWHYLQNGFRQLGCKVVLKRELSDLFQATRQRGVLPFVVKHGNTDRLLWYDTSDFLNGYYEILQGNQLYFKIMLTPDDCQCDDRIRLIGQTAASVKFPSVADGLMRRECRGTHDVLFMGRATDFGIRAEAVRLIRSQGWRSATGLAPHPKREPPPANLRTSKLPFMEHLEIMRDALICPAFPGVGGPWTWRHTEILGLGRLLIMPETECLEFPFAYPWRVTCAPDLSDFVEKVNYYLAHEDARESIARNGRMYYETYLSAEAQARYVLREIGVG